MFAKKQAPNETSSKHRASKPSTSKARRTTIHERSTSRKIERSRKVEGPPPSGDNLASPIITLCVGQEQRLFACHESVLSSSPFFAAICRGQYLESNSKRVNLPDEIPEVFSSVLEFLYKGDYYPRLINNKRRGAYELEDAETNNGGRGAVESTVYHPGLEQVILKDTLLYCTAERYGLDDLKRLALRKQGLQSGIQCATILASARYAYDNTPDSDSKLRAHYLALIIRSRNTFKRSGTLQAQMEVGGKMFFDLFVAMCNHMDDISTITKSPR